MNIVSFGIPLIWFAVAAAGLSAAMFAGAAAKTDCKAGKCLLAWATGAYGLTLAAVLGICTLLSTLLLNHHFEVDYVYRYSSRELPTGYLFATFWAGQDGSFLLWAFWIASLGQILSFTLTPVIRARVMTIFVPVLLVLLVLLLVRNPFAPYIADAGQSLHPADGIGLNPLLENPWMVIHPPTLFLGFAGLTVPFAFALAALIWGDDPEWYRRAWPWALFTFSALGLGVMLGGYWAYETLGWGGFWGWDPVEDGPLVPWLSTVALLHAIQVNRVRGGLRRTTLFLGLFGFTAALYETFLTRTGILDKFSNHSFSTLGGVANNIVLYFLLATAAGSLGMLIWRSCRIKSDITVWEKPNSREFGLALSVIVTGACALIVAVGMSAPLITGCAVTLHLMPSQSSVSPDFFNKANFPEAVLLAIGMAVGPYLSWGGIDSKNLKPLLPSLALAIVFTIVYCLVGVHITHIRLRPVMLLLFFTCTFAVVANLQILGARLRPRNTKIVVRSAGGALAHIGAALILLGVVGLVLFTRKESPTLALGRPVSLNALPYQITYTGMTSSLFDRDNNLKFRVADLDGKPLFNEMMPFAVRNVEGTHQLLARPSISIQWWGDLYFAFENGPEVLAPNELHHFTIHRGETLLEQGDRIMLKGYSIPPDVNAQVAKGIIPDFYPVTAELIVTNEDGKISNVAAVNTRYKDDPIAPAMPESLLPGTGSVPKAIAFEGVDPDSDVASFYIRDSNQPLITSFTIEVSTRPTIGLVWIGTLLLVIGGLLSMIRRAGENKLSPIQPPSTSGTATKSTSGDESSAKLSRNGHDRQPDTKRETVRQ
jgi:cytochrome c-type biogenesis protein CcmF